MSARTKAFLVYLVAGLIVIAGFVFLTGCGTQTHEEIKYIGGHEVLCTWTVDPTEPWVKNDYRCDPVLP